MGIYYKTYLCCGNGTTFECNRKVKIADDQIIESHEWVRGYVKLSDLFLALASLSHIKLEPSIFEDLFLEEVLYSSIDFPKSTTSSKFILIEHQYTFTI